MKRTLLLALATTTILLAGLADAQRGRPPREGPLSETSLTEDPGNHARPPRERAAPPERRIALDLDFEPAGPPMARDHVVVRFAREMPDWQRRQVVTAAGGGGFRPARRDAFTRVDVAPGDSVEALLARLHGIAGVVSAEPDPLCWAPARRVVTLAAAPGAAAADFTDPLYFAQWTLHRIRLEEAVDRNGTGGAGVIVAVLDTGVAFGNGASFPARRGIDLEGASFLPGIDLVDGGPPFDEGSGEPGFPTSPRFGHGTFAASQIVAQVNNGISGAGVAPRVTILPVRVLGTGGFGTFSDVAEGIDFAVAQGAKVISMSLGGSEGAGFLQAAVERAAAAGVVLVAAAGNEADEPDPPDDVAFPARYEQVIAVGASGFNDQRVDYSNTGPGLDIMAPAGENAGDEVGQGLPDGAVAPSFLHFPVSGQTSYGTFIANGTSFAVPQVSGGAALLIALGVDDQELLRDLLLVTVRDLASPGFDQQTGHGLLDLLEAHRGLGFAF